MKRSRYVVPARSSSGAGAKALIRCSSFTRAVISSPVSVCIRSVPNASTLNDASAVP
jgi:hypothetical protein